MSDQDRICVPAPGGYIDMTEWLARSKATGLRPDLPIAHLEAIVAHLARLERRPTHRWACGRCVNGWTDNPQSHDVDCPAYEAAPPERGCKPNVLPPAAPARADAAGDGTPALRERLRLALIPHAGAIPMERFEVLLDALVEAAVPASE